MGKNLKGKECGKGICQRKDERYYVRYESKTGGLLEKYFRSLPDARNWLEEVTYKEKHGTHAGIKTTMDRYVHVTDGSLTTGVRQFEQHRQTIAL